MANSNTCFAHHTHTLGHLSDDDIDAHIEHHVSNKLQRSVEPERLVTLVEHYEQYHLR